MTNLPYTYDTDDPNVPPVGLIVLSTDETIESDFRTYFRDRANPIFASRIYSAPSVTADSLGSMQNDLRATADLLPKTRHFPVIAYGCTSASSVIGSDKVEQIVKSSCDVGLVTNPLRAATACAEHHGISKFALLSPYIEEVNETLRAAFMANGISTDVFGSFGEGEDPKVVRIAQSSIIDAAIKLGSDPSVEGVFMSCTNLPTINAIPKIESALGKPVLSSNQSLAWHIKSVLDD